MRKTIEIEKLRLRANLGWYDAERAHPQVIEVNLTYSATLASVVNDDLGVGLSYSDVIGFVEETVAGRSWKLIETMGTDLARSLFEKFPVVDWLSISIRKFVYAQTSGVAFRLEIARDELALLPNK